MSFKDQYGNIFNNPPEEPIINQPTTTNNSYQTTQVGSF